MGARRQRLGAVCGRVGGGAPGAERASAMGAVAWAGRHSARQHRRPSVSARALQRDVCQVQSLGQSALGGAHVYGEPPALQTAVRAAISPRRGERDGGRGGHGPSGGEPTLLSNTPEAVVPTWCTCVAADTREDAGRGVGGPPASAGTQTGTLRVRRGLRRPHPQHLPALLA